jgi:hypothetical protein
MLAGGAICQNAQSALELFLLPCRYFVMWAVIRAFPAFLPDPDNAVPA